MNNMDLKFPAIITLVLSRTLVLLISAEKPTSKVQVSLKNKRKQAMANLRDDGNTGDALR